MLMGCAERARVIARRNTELLLIWTRICQEINKSQQRTLESQKKKEEAEKSDTSLNRTFHREPSKEQIVVTTQRSASLSWDTSPQAGGVHKDRAMMSGSERCGRVA